MSNTLKLPASWVQVTVADLGKVVSGGTPSTKEPFYWNGNISWISPSDLTGYSNKFISKGAKSITQVGLKNSSATIMPAGSIHFSSRAPIGYTVISACEMTTNQGFKSLVPAQGVFNEYIYYYFKSAKQLAELNATGTTFKEISGSAFSKLPLPLPPTNEQHRIVAKIEELFSELEKGVESLKTAREQLKVYRQSVLKAAFEGRLTEDWRKEHAGELESANELLARIKSEREARFAQRLAEWQQAVESWEAAGKPGKKTSKPKKPKELPPLTPEELAELPQLPEGWGWIRLGACDVDVFDGPFGSNLKGSDYVPAGIRVIRLENIGVLEFKNDKESFVSEEKYDTISKHTVRSGDVIFSSFIADGTRVVVLPEYIGRAINKADCFCVRAGANSLSSEYIAAYLSTRLVFTLLESGIHGATRPRINTTQLKNCPFPICGSGEQEQIVQEIESRFSVVEKMEQTIEESLQKAEALRQSILKRAFEGKLVPQDENDEPASKLLERIRAERAATTNIPKRGRKHA